jgi:DNA-binding CsgD family transcriptional regulator/PAS domain-containing protein
MSFALSSERLDRLGTALQTVLTPAGEGGPARWYRAVIDASCALVDAHVGTVLDPSGSVLGSTADPALVSPYATYYRTHDQCTREMLRRRMEVASTAMIHSPDRRLRTEFFTDYVVPNRLGDMLCLNTFTERGPGVRMLLSYFGRQLEEPEMERNAALVRALVPGFRAAVESFRLWAGDAERLGSVLDGLPGALALCAEDGAVAHRNAALAQLLAADPESGRVMREVSAAALAVARRPRDPAAALAAPPGEREVRTATGRYTLRATRAEEGVLGPRPLVVVAVSTSAPRPLSDPGLRERFGLTEREVEVARCLAQGLTNAALARRLVVSAHTARHHTEAVLRKLGVSSRAQVAPALYGLAEN